jgi:SAM-dependent methyltransferase
MGTATVQGQLWGSRAEDWAAIQEWAVRPVYDAVLDELGPWHGKTILDVGCGSGAFASLAAARGARVAGVDAAPELVDIAERRVATGAFRVGEMENLPYANSSFNVACGMNSFQYAANPARALSETARVVRPGGSVVAMVGGTADECEAAAYMAALGGLLPSPPDPVAGPFALAPGALETLFAAAGLSAGELRAVACPWYYPDERTALRGLLSAGPAVRAIGHSGEDAVMAAVLAAIAPYRCGNGSYLLRNTFHYTVATV